MSNQYGQASLRAMELILSPPRLPPAEAWTKAVEEIIISKSSRAKPCPKMAFLGLCDEGEIKGVPKGDYSHAKYGKSKPCAIQAAHAIRTNVALAKLSTAELWSKLPKAKGRTHNHEMDVVLALWDGGKL